MTTPYTIWHYLDFIIIAALLTAAIVYTLKQKELTQKGSFITVYCVIALILLIITVVSINGYTKKILLSNLNDHRFLATESIIYTGIVRNVGSYDVGQVEIEIKIFDKGLRKQGRSSYQSTAFQDYYNDVDIRRLFGYQPDAQPTSYIVRKTVAEELKAGQRKEFAVSIRYPSNFSGYTSEERLVVH